MGRDSESGSYGVRTSSRRDRSGVGRCREGQLDTGWWRLWRSSKIVHRGIPKRWSETETPILQEPLSLRDNE